MADDDEEEIGNVNELRRIDEGFGMEVVGEELVNRVEREAAVSGVEGAKMPEAVFDSESEGFEFGGSEVVVGVVMDGVEGERRQENRVVESDEVKIVEEGDDEFEAVKGGGDVKLETIVASEDFDVIDVVEEKEELEKNGDMERISESITAVEGEDGEGNLAGNSDLIGMGIEDAQTEDRVEKKGGGFENNLAACRDVENINEYSKNVEKDGGEENVAGKSDLSSMVIEDCHMKDAVEEKEDEFVKNQAAESLDDMGKIDHSIGKVTEDDGEERAAGGSHLIGKDVEDCHKNAALEEKGKEEENLAVTAISDTAQRDESMNTLKKEEVVDDNVAGNSDIICMVTEDSHTNDATVVEKGKEYEKNMALEQCAVVSARGDKSKGDGVREENVAEVSEKIGVEISKGQIDVKNEARDEDEEMGSEEGNTNSKDKVEEDLLAGPDVEISELEPTTGDGDEEMGLVEENTDIKEKFKEDISAVSGVEISLQKVAGDADEEMGSEEENTGNKKKLEGSLSAAPDVEFSLHNVVLEPTTGNEYQEMGLEVENKEKKEKLEEDLSTAPGVEFSLQNVVPETTSCDGDEGMRLEVENIENKEMFEEDLLTGADVEFSLHSVVPVTGDGYEEMVSEEENSENKEKLEEDLSAAPDVEFSLHNVELEPTAGEEDEEFVDREEQSRADAVESQIETPESEKSSINPKRGRKPSKVALTKKTEEDVCFICFDGGDLVVCDRR